MTTIEWTDRVWNPVTGCTKVSQGCKNCYAEALANRRLPHGGFKDREFTEVRCHPERLSLPLSWQKPQRVFVNSMSDLFHEDVPDGFISAAFITMSRAPLHTFQVLTKRPVRMLRLVKHWCEIGLTLREGCGPILPNVWLGVSIEDQATAKERVWPLLETPAARRFVSYEPALGPVDLNAIEALHANWRGRTIGRYLDWVIVGGESGPGARPFDVKWARTVLAQCRQAETPVFIKQMGRYVIDRNDAGFDGDDDEFENEWPACTKTGDSERYQGAHLRIHLRNRKGGDPAEWPKALRVREFPCA